jgi:hemerythrin
VYHFQCEEELMDLTGVDPEHAQRHRETHRQFVQQVTDWMTQRHAAGQIDLPQLLDYLANWLVFHILGDDQSMGRQVAAIRSGSDAHAAFVADTPSNDPRTVILLGGLRRLYSDLIERNADLRGSLAGVYRALRDSPDLPLLEQLRSGDELRTPIQMARIIRVLEELKLAGFVSDSLALLPEPAERRDLESSPTFVENARGCEEASAWLSPIASLAA